MMRLIGYCLLAILCLVIAVPCFAIVILAVMAKCFVGAHNALSGGR